MINLEEKINELYNNPSDINEHLPTIIKYGQECEHITEMGVRSVLSTWGWLASAPKSKLISYDLYNPSRWGGNIKEVEETAKAYGLNFEFIEANVLEIDIEKTDLLFIDTVHKPEWLAKELMLHQSHTKKYIVMHDTVTNNANLHQVIKAFTQINKRWEIIEYCTLSVGYTVIKRISI